MAYTFAQRVTLAIVPRVVTPMLRMLGATLRYEDVFEPAQQMRMPGDEIAGPTIFAFWHRSLLACAHRFRDKQIAILISRSFDGELIARIVERLGFVAVRGSSSQAGASGLRSLVEAYENGHRCAITVDGPRGPAMIAQPGATQLAELVSAPWVGTFYALPLRAWTLNSWDRFLIPKPFSRVRLTWPQHIVIQGMDRAKLQAQIQTSLDQAVTMAGPGA